MATMRNPAALTDLPLELLWMVSEYLSPVDLACLALGNRHLLHSFAGAAFKNFSNGRTGNPTDDARIQLLSRLSCDLPQYHLCFICLRLHLWKKAGLPSYHFKVNHRTDALDYTNWYLINDLPLSHHPSHTLYRFHFVHLQLAMRRFYYGPEFGIPVESLLYTEIKASRFKSNGPLLLHPPINKASEGDTQQDNMMILFSAEARICSTPPALCMRTQDIAVVTRHNLPRLWPCRENGPMSVCRHIPTFDPGFDDILASQIRHYCSTTSPPVPADQGSCDKCNTSWQLEIRTLDETHASLILTIWMDLGPGLSVEDPQWKYRLFNVPPSLSAKHEIVDSRLRFERDSVQARSPNALPEDEMYHRNMSLLEGKRYQTVMTPVDGRIYVLHGQAEAKAKTSPSRCIIL
ncbi:hypothetical protein P168DRAFT_19095 [Aspergillus campestris IBT 28561]|uniref:F-box domain-containing protein n=1 Tax=Aspergillus campestris (strain IBT 28561) TaxID=1392248 RepID=A0A2I1DFD6_ASPC2|nr:uncharacterized protein P168DRAFT_19095 [Aspergillus campestris IBT 28561]PKY08570.1 hypothetical protein P168DRAFT_19095 [Aspergillus campestris IBT 28561]